MKKITFSFFVLLAISTKFYSQTLKTMTSDNDDGKMTYQYYEDSKSSENIKHGAFSFKKNLKDNITGGTYSQTITGNFKNNFRDGVWSFAITRIDFPNDGGSYTTESTTSIQTFKNGLPDGPWKLNSTYKSRNRNYVNGYYSWGAFGKTYTEFANTNFIDGYITGVTTYKNPESAKSKTITLNKSGFVTGNYIFENLLSNTEITFDNNGIVTKFVDRNTNGQVQSKIDFDSELLEIANKYIAGEIKENYLKEKHVKIDTIGAYNYVDISSIFEHDCYLLPYLNGDKTYNSNSSQTKRIYGRYILAERMKLIDLSKNNEYLSAKDNANVYAYKSFLENHSFEMSQSDIEKVTNEKLLLESMKDYGKKFDANLETIRQKFKIYKDLKGSKEISSLAYLSLSNAIKSLDSIKANIREKVNLEVTNLNQAKNSSNKEDIYKFNYKNAYEITEEYLKKADAEFVPRANAINRIMDKSISTDLAIFRTKSAFGLINVQDVPKQPSYLKVYNSYLINSYGQNKTLPNNEVMLMSIYDELIQSLVGQLKASHNLTSTDSILENLNIISEHILALKNKDFKAFLKTLKNAKTDDEKINLIINNQII